MKYTDIVADLQKNNVKTTGCYTTEQLLAIFNEASVEVPSARPDAVTLTYSGPVDPGLGYTWQLAEPIGTQSAGAVRTVGQTDASKLLNDDNLKRALLKANNFDEAIVRNILDGEYETDQSGNKVRIKPGWSDIMSERFVLAAKGPIVSLTPNADPTRVWGTTELDAALRSQAPTINGIARQDLILTRDRLIQTTGSESRAKAILLAYVNELSAEHTSLLSTIVDNNGKIITNPTTNYAQHVETKQFFDRLGIEAPGTELPAASNKTSLLDLDSRSKVKTSQFVDAQIAHRIVQQHATERLAQAKTIGDAADLARASRYLNQLGIIGDVISLTLVASEANAAYAKGDPAAAQRIVQNGLLDYTGGLLGGLLAAKLIAAGVAPLVFFGPGGALLAGGLTLTAGLLGGLFGSELLRQFADQMDNFDPSKLSEALRQLAGPEGQYDPGGWREFLRRLADPTGENDPSGWQRTFKNRTADKAFDGTIRRDPLAFDLDGDGIETIGLRDGKPILFDHDADGIKTGTGWLKPDDAWLVLDRNGNGSIDTGRELFGLDTLKSNNKLATDGFDALKDMDANNDGKIDLADQVYSQLRLWRDSNQDGISQSLELSSLDAIGITSIGIKATASILNLGNGNIQTSAGVFSRSDGTSGTTGMPNGSSVNLNLVTNSFYRQFCDQIAITDQASKLPALRGSGQVRDLPEAISRSPELGRLVESYLVATTRQGQIDLLDSFLEKWADTSNMKSLKAQAEALAGTGVNLSYSLAGFSPGTSDYQVFVRKLGIVERFMGFTYGGPTGAVRFTPLVAGSGLTSVSINRPQIESILMAYDMFKNDLYEALLFQSRLQGYTNKISIGFSNDKAFVDITALENAFSNAIAAKPREGIIDLIEFIATAGPAWLSKLNWKAHDFLLAELNKTPELGAFSNDFMNPSVRFAASEENSLSGSSRPDLLVGTLGSDRLLGGAGNDILHGKVGNDTLDGGSGDDLIDGGDGNDQITDHSGLNIMQGGAGNDIIRGRGTFAGGSGDDQLQAGDAHFGDTYLFQIGDGKDVINDFGYSGLDAITFGAGINPSALPLHRVGLDLLFFVNANDQLTIKNWFSSSLYYIEQISFSNGSAWNADTIRSTAILSSGSANADSLSGWQGIDHLFGGSGNDTLDGGSGDDLIDGGDGNDQITDTSGLNIMQGGAGNDVIRGRGTFAGGSGDDQLQAGDAHFGDTYLFQIGDGKDVINDFGYSGLDAITFGAGINPSALPLHRVGLDLLFFVNANDQLTIKNWFSSSLYYIEKISFSNGLAWNVDTIRSTAILSSGSANADSLSGWQGIDHLDGADGNDTMSGGGGNDSLFGGSGNDTLSGEAGDDLIDGGDGNDLITDHSGLNIMQGGAGNDIIRGRGTFAGGSGDDQLQAVDAHFGDTYLFQIGDGKDVINDFGYSGLDAIVFGGGINASMLWFRKSGADLEVTRIGSAEGISIKNWYTSVYQQIERFHSADGKILANTNVDALVRQMAAFSPPSLGQMGLSGDYSSALGAVISANWL